MLKISWKDRLANSSVQQKAEEKRSILNTMWQQTYRACPQKGNYARRHHWRKNER